MLVPSPGRMGDGVRRPLRGRARVPPLRRCLPPHRRGAWARFENSPESFKPGRNHCAASGEQVDISISIRINMSISKSAIISMRSSTSVSISISIRISKRITIRIDISVKPDSYFEGA